MNLVALYEIFQKPPGQQPLWVETATSLNEARIRLKQLSAMFPANYFIFDSENACFLVPCHAAERESEVSTSAKLSCDA
jgi:hypothetical protein